MNFTISDSQKSLDAQKEGSVYNAETLLVVVTIRKGMSQSHSAKTSFHFTSGIET